MCRESIFIFASCCEPLSEWNEGGWLIGHLGHMLLLLLLLLFFFFSYQTQVQGNKMEKKYHILSNTCVLIPNMFPPEFKKIIK